MMQSRQRTVHHGPPVRQGARRSQRTARSGGAAAARNGAAHAVDSSEMAFKAAGMGAAREAILNASPQVLQPIMKVEISVPEEFQGAVIGGVNKRSGSVLDSETNEGFA